MIPTYRVGLLAGATTLAFAGVVCAQDAQSETMSEIAKLRAELADLKAQTGDNWLTEQRASEIRGLVQDVLADADTRSSLQGSGMTAGWDNGFFLASPDGNYRLNVQGELQIRYMMNFRDSDPSIDSTTHGFENSNTRLIFSGNVVDRTWKYRVQGNFSNGDGGSFGLEDAWIQKDFDNGLYVRAGQFKPPVLREELIADSRQLLVDRSLLNETYSQDWSQGIELGWEGDWIRGMVMWHDGLGNRNTPALSPTTEFAIAARAEILLGGTWRQFDDFTSWSGESFGALIGVAANWQRDEFGQSGVPAGGKAAPFLLTVDAQVEFGGANLYGAFIYNDSDTQNSGSLKQYGFVIQGGVFLVPDQIELFGRYEWADSDLGDVKDLSLLTAGVNWYFAKHNVKWTTDIGLSFNSLENGASGFGWSSENTGWLPDGPGGDDQFLIRSQFQLLF
jgi:hypothetical protein